MTDRSSPSDAALEARLADLASALVLPAAPPMASAVAARLAEPRTQRRWSPWTAWRLGRPMVLALLALLLLVAVAAAVVVTLIGGVRLVNTRQTPSALPSSVGAARGLGTATSLEHARATLGFTIRLPSLPGIGAPDEVYITPDRPAGGSLALVYGARNGYPADSTGVGLLITEFRADISPELFDKMIHTGVRVERTTVDGSTAYWISGGRHFFFYRDANGNEVDETLRLVGDTLIWEASGLTLRIEGAPSLTAARRVAASLR